MNQVNSIAKVPRIATGTLEHNLMFNHPKIFLSFLILQKNFRIMLNPQIAQKTTTETVSIRLFLKSAQKGQKELNVPHENSEVQFHLVLHPDLEKSKKTIEY